MHKLRTSEADFNFLGMDVNVHFVVRHFEKKQRRWRNRMRMNVAISLVNGVQNQFVANQALVHEDVDAAVIGALNFRTRRETANREGGFFFLGLERWLSNRTTEWCGKRRNF